MFKTRKKFNEPNLVSSLEMIQAVSPTNDLFPAHWWNSGTGKMIKNSQNEWINKFKEKAKEAKSKIEINKIFKEMGIYPDFPKVKKSFWTKGFGKTIQLEWDKMINSWIEYINTLEGSITI